MDWEQVLASAGISTIVSTGFAILLYRNQKRLDFDFEYKKYIVQKRQDAYDSIMLVVAELSNGQLTKDGSQRYHSVFDDKTYENRVRFYNEKIANAMNGKAYWLTKEMSDELEKLVNIIGNLANAIQDMDFAETTKAIIKKYEIIENQRDRVEALYMKDIMRLTDINAYFRSHGHRIMR